MESPDDASGTTDSFVKVGNLAGQMKKQHRIITRTVQPALNQCIKEPGTITVLLPAQEWKFPLMESPDDASGTTDSHEDVAFPPLPGFLDALIER
jgi:hypothetical protein